MARLHTILADCQFCQMKGLICHCCGDSALNPTIYPNLVTFDGRKGDTWYYAEIGVFGQP
jgi:hypothetical protein